MRRSRVRVPLPAPKKESDCKVWFLFYLEWFGTDALRGFLRLRKQPGGLFFSKKVRRRVPKCEAFGSASSKAVFDGFVPLPAPKKESDCKVWFLFYLEWFGTDALRGFLRLRKQPGGLFFSKKVRRRVPKCEAFGSASSKAVFDGFVPLPAPKKGIRPQGLVPFFIWNGLGQMP